MLRKGSLSFYDWCIKNNYKDYLDLWDYKLNKKDPKDVAYTVNNKYFFKCAKGVHDSYLYSIRSITVNHSHGPQCPICGSIYQWCLDNNRKDIIEAWDKTKNMIDMKNTSKSSGKKAWFTFEYYSYYYPICYITQKDKNNSDPVYKYYNSFGYYLIKKYGVNGINNYWSDKNDRSPFEYDKGSSNKVWIKCVEKDYHDDYLVSCYAFTGSSQTRCPMCASKIIHPLDSFAQYNINRYGEDWLKKCWMDDNDIDPFKISCKNNSIKVHLRCIDVEYHDYWITPNNYNKNDRVCCYCNAKGSYGKIHPLDSLGAKHPEILNLWSEKNTKTPYEYTEFSHDYIYLKCENGIHEDYARKISDYSRFPYRLCPSCSNNISSYERLTREYLEQLPYKVLYENQCNIYPINPKTNYPMPYDNEIVELRLIIEVMGKQHYEITGFHKLSAKHNGTSEQYEFEYSQWKDRYKMNYAINNGYHYLALPYYVFSDKKEYIDIINNKINEIINLESVETAGFEEKSSN